MHWIQSLILASCLGLATAALADGGIIVGDDGSIGGGGEVNEDPGGDVVSVPGMIAMDATARHLTRVIPERLPEPARLARERAQARSAHGHEVVSAIHGDGLSGRDVAAVAAARCARPGAPGALLRARARSGVPGRGAGRRP